MTNFKFLIPLKQEQQG